MFPDDKMKLDAGSVSASPDTSGNHGTNGTGTKSKTNGTSASAAVEVDGLRLKY